MKTNLKTYPGKLTIETVAKDNSHFNSDTICLQDDQWLVPNHPDRQDFGFSHWISVTDGKWFADYMWHPDRIRWELVAN